MRALWTATLLLIVATTTLAQDTHWSRQFPRPKKPTEMLPGTGMSDGGGKPTASRVKWGVLPSRARLERNAGYVRSATSRGSVQSKRASTRKS